MTNLPAAAEPRHTRGGAGGARPDRAARRSGQWVKYPARVVFDADSYAPADTRVYGKINALAQRGLATASMENIASYLGISKSGAERAARRLSRPAPTDGVTELFTRRRTHKVTGTGQTADRWCRTVAPGEAYLWAPVLAADTLSGTLHRLYLALRHAHIHGHHPTLAELARVLRHHGGARAGQPLADESISRLLDDLEATGWITIGRRGGYRGRHLITVHDHPIHPTGPTPTPHTDDGSGPDLAAGSLASKEDQHSPDDDAQAGGPIRRRRTTGSTAVDNSPPRAAASALPAAYTGPGLQLSPRVTDVLAPVRHLLPDIRPYVLRRIAHEIGRQLDAGTTPERLRTRLTHRYATTDPVRDPGRWILGAGLPRHGCGLPHCESGTLLTPWAPPAPCHVCREPGARPPDGAPDRPPPDQPAPGSPATADPRPPDPTTWCTCPDCHPPAAPAA